jgi:hypothetical protein
MSDEPLVCTWCNRKIKDGDRYAFKIDAAGITHVFHPECKIAVDIWMKTGEV